MKLTGLHILVTRPGLNGQVLCEEIRKVGGEAVDFPAIHFLPPINDELLEKQIVNLTQYDYLIFISPQAVSAVAKLIKHHWTIFPSALEVFAIGEGTKKSLIAEDLPVSNSPRDEWNSEGLLKLPEFQTVKDKKIGLVCGDGGRDLLANTLQQRGAEVEHLIAYRRTLPVIDTEMAKNLLQKNNINVVVCTSGDGLKNLKTLMQPVWSQLKSIPVLVVSERIKSVAQELGFNKIYLAKNASHDAIIEGLSHISVFTKGKKMEDSIKNNPNPREDITTLPPNRSRRGWLNLGILFSTFAAIVLITAFYFAYSRLLKSHQETLALINQLDQTVQQNQSDITAFQSKISNLEDSVQTTLANQQKTLTEFKSLQPNKSESWQVAEAQYLTNLANTNLQAGNDVSLAITLLQTADQKLQNLTEPNAVAIRKALATDIAALQATPKVDVEGIYLQVSALNAEVDKLPLPNRRPEATAASVSSADDNLAWWKQGWQETKDALGKIVIVRYTKPGERPFIPPEQQDFLYQNLHAKFEQALSAVAQRQPEIYRTSLQQASEWVKHYFLPDSPITQAMLTSLGELVKVNLRPTLPTLSVSLRAFQDYFAQSGSTETTNASLPKQS